MKYLPTVIVTGSRGRIGRAILRQLSEQWAIRPVSRNAGHGFTPLSSLWDPATSIDAEALVHAAWSCVPASAERDPQQWAREDFPLLEKIIERLQQLTDPPLLVFLSTGAVYGNAHDHACTEQDTLDPRGAYARGKRRAEELLRTSGLPVCILRVSNLYGLASHPDDAQGVIPHLIRHALSGEGFVQWGEDPIKDYLHRDDFLAALDKIVQSQLTGIWNLSSHTATPLSRLIQLVESGLGSPVKITRRDSPAWDVTNNQIANTRLCKALDWQPQVSIEEGMRREVELMTTFAQ